MFIANTFTDKIIAKNKISAFVLHSPNAFYIKHMLYKLIRDQRQKAGRTKLPAKIAVNNLVSLLQQTLITVVPCLVVAMPVT